MYKFLLHFTLMLSLCSFSFAGLPLFEDSDIQTLHLVKEWRTKSTRDGKIINDETVMWGLVYFDIPNNRISERWINTPEKPAHPLNPDIVRLYVDQMYYDISHPHKTVTIDNIGFRKLTAYFQLYGWFYEGLDLKREFALIPENQWTLHDDGKRSVWFKIPQVVHPAEFFVNQQNLPVKIRIFLENPNGEDPKGWQSIETLDWTNVSETDFWYPSHQTTTITGKNSLVTESETWIHEIQLNLAIPPRIFDTDYPSDYRVSDRRSLLKVPGF